MGQRPRERRLWAHCEAVPLGARVHSQRQLWHLQRLWEDLGWGSEGAGGETERGCSSGSAARLRESSRHCTEGNEGIFWPSVCLPPKTINLCYGLCKDKELILIWLLLPYFTGLGDFRQEIYSCWELQRLQGASSLHSGHSGWRCGHQYTAGGTASFPGIYTSLLLQRLLRWFWVTDQRVRGSSCHCWATKQLSPLCSRGAVL